jgi:hypothetical protein
MDLLNGGLAYDMVLDGSSFNTASSKTVGVIQPKRDNSLGTIYIKDGKIFVAYFNGNKISDEEIDVEITTLQDLKKLLTIKTLKEKHE